MEKDRLDLYHHMMLSVFDGRHYLAPIEEDKLHRMLDIGTGTGICQSSSTP